MTTPFGKASQSAPV